MNPTMRSFTSLARQRGQALIYGIFVLMGALAATFYVFNTGQLASEKTKLVNTADAVAYSAGVMHARALNFSAYTNRALIANETTIAQMVSISSWLAYAKDHNSRVAPLLCATQATVPGWLGTLKYAGLCYLLTVSGGSVTNYADQFGQIAVKGFAYAAEGNKVALKGAQVMMFAGFLPARHALMKKVAEANYLNDGVVEVDTIPLVDNFSLFEGEPFIKYRTGNQRARMREVILNSALQDDFVKNRDWDEKSPIPCPFPSPARGHAERNGSTTLNGYNSWQGRDNAAYHVDELKLTGILKIPKCKHSITYPLGNATKTAKSSGGDLYYSGVPQFLELSDKALGYKPNHADPNKRNLGLRFAIRLTRDRTQQKTSAGTSGIKPAGRLELYAGNQAGDTMGAVATSEVYFERPVPLAGQTELGSLFNPYWQVHLVSNSPASVIAALALQGVP